MKKVKITEVEMSVAEFVEQNQGITRHDVYKMIKNGEIKAHRGYKNKWILEIEVKEEFEVEEPVKPSKKSSKKTKEYTVKEFVEAYNKKHPKSTITVPEARKFIADDKLAAKKVSGKWVVTATPSKRIK